MKIIWDANTEGGAAAPSEDNIERALEIEETMEEEIIDEPAKPTLHGFGLGPR